MPNPQTPPIGSRRAGIVSGAPGVSTFQLMIITRSPLRVSLGGGGTDLPSYYREGIPRTILEAMAMGRAIITTDSPGCRETVTPELNGVLVRPRDPAAVAAAMERFVLDPDLAARMGQRSREMAEERFDVRRVNRVLLEHMELVSPEPAVAP